jgi:magnesium transporter
LVAGSALAINTIIAVCVGGLLPLILKLLKKDPALAAAPILTTVTDMCGFFLALGFATILLSKLT